METDLTASVREPLIYLLIIHNIRILHMDTDFLMAEDEYLEQQEAQETENETLNEQVEELDEYLEEYDIDARNLYEEPDDKDLVDIMNDDGSMFTAEQLGISLGLAEEIASENLFRYVDSLAKACRKEIQKAQQEERKVPEGATMVSVKSTAKERKLTEFDKYIDGLIADKKERTAF